MRSAPAASASRASRAPTSSGSPSPSTAHDLTSVGRGDERLEHGHAGPRSAVASAATGAAQPAAELSQERALGRGRRACVRDRRSPRAARARASSSARHCTASAPWPGRGQHRLGRRATPSPRPRARAAGRPRRRARRRRTRRRAPCGCACRRSPGSTGSRDRAAAHASCAARRRLLVPTTAPAASSAERATFASHEAVADVLAQPDGADHDARRILGREVLERVHREIDLAARAAPARAPP